MIHTGTPLRMRLRVETTGAPSEPGPWRTLVAGQSVIVWWTYKRLPRDQHGETPPPQLVQEGRTAPFSAHVDFHFDDRVGNNRRLVYWARPDQGRLQHWSALPPGRHEALPDEGSVELLTVAMSDLASGEVDLKRRDLQTRVHKPKTFLEDDRLEVVRVYLDIAQPEGS